MVINRIIALDDDEDYLSILQGFAKIVGLDFVGYTSYAELDLKKLTSSDLFVLDIYMPGSDALDILMDIAKHEQKAFLAIMSGADSDILDSISSLAQQLSLKSLGSLSKPVKFSDFHTLINVSKSETDDHILNLKAEVSIPFAPQFDELGVQDWFDKKLIYPVFQPQFDATTKEIVGFECLTRIKHPILQHVEPAEFVSYVEDKGDMEIYTVTFISESMAKVARLLEDNPELSCSFNISANNLNKRFADLLVDQISHYTFAARQIVFEITESNAVKMSAEAMYAISRLKVAGVKLSIDDFGTGYSSIKQLVELPFDEVKIDRSFVSEMTHNEKASAIIKATFNMSDSLGFKLVVEGVETEEQYQLIMESGSSKIQGFLFSEPLSIENLIFLLKQQNLNLP
jgi:EAL domain-containing protein (putative c-di-GMP-specific phosphodiesterase class I)